MYNKTDHQQKNQTTVAGELPLQTVDSSASSSALHPNHLTLALKPTEHGTYTVELTVEHLLLLAALQKLNPAEINQLVAKKHESPAIEMSPEDKLLAELQSTIEKIHNIAQTELTNAANKLFHDAIKQKISVVKLQKILNTIIINKQVIRGEDNELIEQTIRFRTIYNTPITCTDIDFDEEYFNKLSDLSLDKSILNTSEFKKEFFKVKLSAGEKEKYHYLLLTTGLFSYDENSQRYYYSQFCIQQADKNITADQIRDIYCDEGRIQQISDISERMMSGFDRTRSTLNESQNKKLQQLTKAAEEIDLRYSKASKLLQSLNPHDKRQNLHDDMRLNAKNGFDLGDAIYFYQYNKIRKNLDNINQLKKILDLPSDTNQPMWEPTEQGLNLHKALWELYIKRLNAYTQIKEFLEDASEKMTQSAKKEIMVKMAQLDLLLPCLSLYIDTHRKNKNPAINTIKEFLQEYMNYRSQMTRYAYESRIKRESIRFFWSDAKQKIADADIDIIAVYNLMPEVVRKMDERVQKAVLSPLYMQYADSYESMQQQQQVNKLIENAKHIGAKIKAQLFTEDMAINNLRWPSYANGQGDEVYTKLWTLYLDYQESCDALEKVVNELNTAAEQKTNPEDIEKQQDNAILQMAQLDLFDIWLQQEVSTQLVSQNNAMLYIFKRAKSQSFDDIAAQLHLYTEFKKDVNQCIHNEMGFSLCLMDKKNYSLDKPYKGKIYLFSDGEYFVLDANQQRCEGKLKQVNLKNLSERLQDPKLIGEVLTEISNQGICLSKNKVPHDLNAAQRMMLEPNNRAKINEYWKSINTLALAKKGNIHSKWDEITQDIKSNRNSSTLNSK